jgi:hypothetical protein
LCGVAFELRHTHHPFLARDGSGEQAHWRNAAVSPWKVPWPSP